ncbi:HET-domain-containing protein [Apiospora arundinis]|uniref:HET-domain-containing protein n=1 Tax=Apiospora arundinis TaxID=335852 RepID=A0ABR2IE03_9PEZI
MPTYHPLNESKREIRLLSIPRPKAPLHEGDLLQCELVQVSLDDLDDQYVKFLGLASPAIRDFRGSRDVRGMLWKWVKFPEQRRQDNLFFNRYHCCFPPVYRGVYREAFDIMLHNWELNAMSSTLLPGRHVDRYRWGDFYALSYEWGDPTRTASILVDGVEVIDYRETLYLWADAICINQQDISERNSQVRLMDEIYTQALKVLTWTGPGSELAPALDLVRQVKEMTVENDMEERGWKAREKLFAKENLPGWSALRDISCRSYWSRLWIIQEQLLASESSILYFGAEYCLISDFFDAIRVWQQYKPFLLKPVEGQELYMPGLSEFVFVHAFYKQDFDRDWSLQLLLCGTMAQQKDKRDKIYGLLSLMDSSVRDVVDIDYSKPYPVVYRDFVHCMIKKTGKLDVIYQLAANYSRNLQVDNDGTKRPYIPSWIPDWSSLDISKGDVGSNLITLRIEGYNAGWSTDHSLQRETDTDCLTCKGFCFDTIDGLGCSRVSESHTDHDVVAAVSSGSDCPMAEDMRQMKDALWECLNIGSMMKLDNDFIDGYPYFPTVLSDNDDGRQYFPGLSAEVLSGMKNRAMPFVEWQRCNQHLNLFGLPLAAFFAQELPVYFTKEHRFRHTTYQKMEIDNNMARVAQWRRIIITARGYVGMAPKGSKQGDSIFLLKGCSVPLVLRPNGDGTYYLVGECYVAGIMRGEAMREFMEDGSIEEMNVVLR